jgi:hypothetical protein
LIAEAGDQAGAGIGAAIGGVPGAMGGGLVGRIAGYAIAGKQAGPKLSELADFVASPEFAATVKYADAGNTSKAAAIMAKSSRFNRLMNTLKSGAGAVGRGTVTAAKFPFQPRDASSIERFLIAGAGAAYNTQSSGK